MQSAEADNIAEIFRRFGEVECRGSSPLYERLAYKIARDEALLEIAAVGRQPIPNLFLGAVHYLLLSGKEHSLKEYYPSLVSCVKEGDAYPEFYDFCVTHRGALEALLTERFVQTNEVRRCGYLMPAFHAIYHMTKQPLALIEIGTSAGLNLCWDHYHYDYGNNEVIGDKNSPAHLHIEKRGGSVPFEFSHGVEIERRVGIDVNPIYISNEPDVNWLRALIWPEHADRRLLLENALIVARKVPVQFVADDASEIITEVLKQVPDDVVPCVFQTHALNQFSVRARERLFSVLADFGKGRDLYFLTRPNFLELHEYRKGLFRIRKIAECDGHGRWLRWLGLMPEEKFN